VPEGFREESNRAEGEAHRHTKLVAAKYRRALQPAEQNRGPTYFFSFCDV
jgi:hypothetical protein